MKKGRLFVVLLSFVFFAPFFVACENSETQTFCEYEIVAEYKPSDCAVTGSVKVTFENPTEGSLSELKFNLYANAYRKDALFKAVSSALYDATYYQGASYGYTTVSSVVGAKGWRIGGEDENILVAELETPLAPEEKVVLDIGFLTKLPHANHRLGITENNTVNLGGWFPVLCGIKDGAFYEYAYTDVGDPFFLDLANYRVELTAPKEYLVASSGACGEEKTLESKKKYVITAENSRDFACVLSENFKVESATVGKTAVSYYYFSDTAPKETLETAKKAITYFSSAFGEYPYETYSVAETGLVFGGMEYPSFSLVSAFADREEYVRSLVHETAHQWWYAAVGSNQTSEAWQDEGLAEYSAALFFEKHAEYGVDKKAIVDGALEEYRSYYDAYEKSLGWVDTRMSRSLNTYLGEYEYRVLSYDKAVVMFDALKESIGEKKFLSGLRKYYAENKFAFALPGNLVGAFERSGVDVAGFFDGFLSGKALL